jgi:hypothetical protein
MVYRRSSRFSCGSGALRPWAPPSSGQPRCNRKASLPMKLDPGHPKHKTDPAGTKVYLVGGGIASLAAAACSSGTQIFRAITLRSSKSLTGLGAVWTGLDRPNKDTFCAADA